MVKRTYYFSGDFANNNVPMWTARLRDISKSGKALLYSDNENDPGRFFWLYYKPLITNIFSAYQAETAGK